MKTSQGESPLPHLYMMTGFCRKNEDYRTGNMVLSKTTVNNLMHFFPVSPPQDFSSNFPKAHPAFSLYYISISPHLQKSIGFSCVCGSPTATLTAVCCLGFKSLCVT